jgi:aspartate-semialdehyde dehydrogenase
MAWQGQQWTVAEACAEAFEGVDVAIFAASGTVSKELAPEAVKRGCTVIDNSSAFRLDPAVPLVVPEVNPEALQAHHGLIANPNCSTAVTLMGLAPLHKAFGLRRFFACTYQAVSGAGDAGIPELEAQAAADARQEPLPQPRAFAHTIAYNVIPHVDTFQPDGYTREEHKMRNETRKILALPELSVSTTCVRVPVRRAHAIAVHAEFERSVDVDGARRAVEAFEGAELCDQVEQLRYPMPIDYSKRVPCGVGRLRRDTAFDNGLALWVVGDQLWKGAALNAIQIAEALVAAGCLKLAASASSTT